MQQPRQPSLGLAERRILSAEQHVREHDGAVDALVARRPTGTRAGHHGLLRRHRRREIRGLTAADVEPERFVKADIRREHSEAEQRHAAERIDGAERALAARDHAAHAQQRVKTERDQHGGARRIGEAFEAERIRNLDLL